MIELVLTGYFTVKSLELDDGVYNILLEDKRTGDLIAYWQKEPGVFKEGTTLDLIIKGECERAAEVIECNGKCGSPWRAEDDWLFRRRNYICNAKKVEIIND